MRRRLASLAAALTTTLAAALVLGGLGACEHMYVAGDAGPHHADVDPAAGR